MYTWRQDTLGNGLRVVTVGVPHLHAAMVSVYALAGSRHDPPSINGVSHFLEHVFFRGCEAYPNSRLLNATLERAGGSLNGVTTRDFGYYYTLIHPEGMGIAFDVLSKMLAAPLMRDVEMEREVIQEEILDEVDEEGRLIDIDTISKRVAFAGHSLSMPIAGDRETVGAIRTEDLRAHHARCYGGGNLVLVVAGPVAHEAIVAEAESAFGALRGGPRVGVDPPPLPPPGPALEYVSHRESQSDVRLTFPALPESDPDYPAQIVLTRILDDGLASRLQQEIVERRGLAYSVCAGVDLMADAALLEIDASTAHSKVPRLLAALQETLGALARNLPDDDEVARAAARHRYDMDFMQDSVTDLTGWFGIGELHASACTLERRVADVAAVGPDEVRRLAARLLRPEKMLAVIVGLADETESRRVIEGGF